MDAEPSRGASIIWLYLRAAPQATIRHCSSPCTQRPSMITFTLMAFNPRSGVPPHPAPQPRSAVGRGAPVRPPTTGPGIDDPPGLDLPARHQQRSSSLPASCSTPAKDKSTAFAPRRGRRALLSAPPSQEAPASTTRPASTFRRATSNDLRASRLPVPPRPKDKSTAFAPRRGRRALLSAPPSQEVTNDAP